MGTSVLTLTTSPIELTDGIERLLRPIGKEMAHELAMMMTIALRFIPTLIDETDKIMKAQKARGADFESGGFEVFDTNGQHLGQYSFDGVRTKLPAPNTHKLYFS